MTPELFIEKNITFSRIIKANLLGNQIARSSLKTCQLMINRAVPAYYRQQRYWKQNLSAATCAKQVLETFKLFNREARAVVLQEVRACLVEV